MPRRQLSLILGTLALLGTSVDASAQGKAAGSGRARDGGVAVDVASQGLRVQNRTPFMLTVYIGGVRSGWIKPFRTELFRGLKGGYHKVYVASHYGTASWGPTDVWVPGTWNLTPPAEGKDAEDAQDALASRIYRRNKNSLVACDKLADRRGEELNGRRADFEIAVDPEGKLAVKVTGDGLSKRLTACYLSVGKTWEVPTTGTAYTVTFQHIP